MIEKEVREKLAQKLSGKEAVISEGQLNQIIELNAWYLPYGSRCFKGEALWNTMASDIDWLMGRFSRGELTFGQVLENISTGLRCFTEGWHDGFQTGEAQ